MIKKKKRARKVAPPVQLSEMELALTSPLKARKPSNKVRGKKALRKVDRLRTARAAGMVHRRKIIVAVGKQARKKVATPAQEVFETIMPLDYGNFVADYSKKFAKGTAFWQEWLGQSIALESSLASVLDDLRRQEDFAELELDLKLTRRILRYDVAHRLCQHLGIDTERALAGTGTARGGTTDDDPLTRLLELLKVPTV